MITAFKTLGGMQKILWGLGIVLAPLFIVSAVSPTPGMQKTARVYQTTDQLSTAPALDNAPAAPEPQMPESHTQPVAEPDLQPTIPESPTAADGNTTIAPSPEENSEKAPTRPKSAPSKAATPSCENTYKSCSTEDSSTACVAPRSSQLSVFGIQLGVSVSDNNRNQDCQR